MSNSLLFVGQRIVYKGDMANASGQGAIVELRKNERAGQMFSMDFKAGKLVPFDSSVSYDVVLDDGRHFPGVYESNIGGEFNNKSCRFMVAEGQADAGEIAELMMKVTLRRAALKAKADEVAAVFAKAQAAALEAGKAMGLIPEAEFKAAGKRGSAAAWNLRQELKAAGIKARVKQPNYYAIDVVLSDDADKAAAKKIMAKYQAGHFDGMTDCYEYDPSAWGSVFGDVRYVSGQSVEGYSF
jgi:hypothetical protein